MKAIDEKILTEENIVSEKENISNNSLENSSTGLNLFVLVVIIIVLVIIGIISWLILRKRE